MNTKRVSVGNGCMLITSEEFANGFLAGHLTYMVEKHDIPCSDEELATLFLTRLQDSEQNSLSGIGFVVGWLATLANTGLKTSEPVNLPVPFAKSVPGGKE